MLIGIDIGGTKISVALVQDDKVLELRSAPSPVLTDLTQLMPTLETLVSDWAQQAEGIGVASTGLVSADEVRFLSAGPDQRLPLQSLLEDRYQLPVLVLNDAWAAAWGEYVLGEHTTEDTLVYITVSTGIGGGIVHNGQLLRGPRGFAAHLGHVCVPRPAGDNVTCSCGRVNCIEAISSGTAIARRASLLLSQEMTCHEVFQALKHEPELAPLIDDCTQAMSEMIADIKALTDTPVVVLGGSVGLNIEFRNRLQKALQSLPEIYSIKLCTPALGKDADVIGAALSLREHMNS